MTSLTDTIIAATVTVLANGLGGLPFVFVRKFPEELARLGWAGAGGLMLSASLFNLIIPGLAEGSIVTVGTGIFLGAFLMAATSWFLEKRKYTLHGVSDAGSHRIILVLATLFIHSIPEGFAIGVSFGSGEETLGLIMTIAIAIHNIPEGVAVSLPLSAEGVSGWKCVGWAIFSGTPQLFAAIPAYLAVLRFRPLLPYAFGFAAGAMIYLVMEEMIPESRTVEQQRRSSAMAGMTGFLFMMALQIIWVA